MPQHRSWFRKAAPLLAVMLAACSVATRPDGIQAPPPQAFAAVPDDSVELHDSADPLPASAVFLQAFTAPDSMDGHSDAQVLAAYRLQAARLGATWISLDRSGGRRHVVSYHVPARAQIVRRAESGSGGGTASGSTSGGSGSVHVRGYCRRDGSCVRSHTRSRPGSRSRPSSRSRSRGGSRRRH